MEEALLLAGQGEGPQPQLLPHLPDQATLLPQGIGQEQVPGPLQTQSIKQGQEDIYGYGRRPGPPQPGHHEAGFNLRSAPGQGHHPAKALQKPPLPVPAQEPGHGPEADKGVVCGPCP